MSDVRQDLFDAVVSALRQINTGNDYRTNAGDRVFEFRDPTEALQLGELPCITIRETNASAEVLTHTVHRYTVQFEISGHEQDQEDTPKKLREIRADILEALGADQSFGGFARYINPTSEEMNVERKGKRVGSVRMQFEIGYQTGAFAPAELHEQPT